MVTVRYQRQDLSLVGSLLGSPTPAAVPKGRVSLEVGLTAKNLRAAIFNGYLFCYNRYFPPIKFLNVFWSIDSIE